MHSWNTIISPELLDHVVLVVSVFYEVTTSQSKCITLVIDLRIKAVYIFRVTAWHSHIYSTCFRKIISFSGCFARTSCKEWTGSQQKLHQMMMSLPSQWVMYLGVREDFQKVSCRFTKAFLIGPEISDHLFVLSARWSPALLKHPEHKVGRYFWFWALKMRCPRSIR